MMIFFWKIDWDFFRPTIGYHLYEITFIELFSVKIDKMLLIEQNIRGKWLFFILKEVIEIYDTKNNTMILMLQIFHTLLYVIYYIFLTKFSQFDGALFL